MAALRGTVEGNRGEASRLGSTDSGLTTTASTWEATIRVDLGHDGTATVLVHPANGASRAPTVVFDGNIHDLMTG